MWKRIYDSFEINYIRASINCDIIGLETQIDIA